jgi:hypothetical protein
MNESNQSISKIANHTVAEAIVPVEVMFRLIFLVIARILRFRVTNLKRNHQHNFPQPTTKPSVNNHQSIKNECDADESDQDWL